jgi:hypothetical protein
MLLPAYAQKNTLPLVCFLKVAYFCWCRVHFEQAGRAFGQSREHCYCKYSSILLYTMTRHKYQDGYVRRQCHTQNCRGNAVMSLCVVLACVDGPALFSACASFGQKKNRGPRLGSCSISCSFCAIYCTSLCNMNEQCRDSD